MRYLLARLSADRSGATAIEYGLIAAFIAVAMVAALPSLRNNVMGLFNNLDNKVAMARKQSND